MYQRIHYYFATQWKYGWLDFKQIREKQKAVS